MTDTSPTFAAHGAAIPALGFGTSPMTGGLAPDTVVAALKAGYRHIDTARKYGTERAVGEAMRASDVPRGDIFLTTKVSHEYLRAEDFAKSVDESLAALKVDYVDLLMVHWPNPEIPLSETMPALAKAKRQGLARHIGVANFNIALLDQAIKLCPEPLVALQAEYHPYLDQTKLLDAARQRGLIYIAYCPLGRGRLFGDPVLAEIAKARGKSVAQIALRWLFQQNVASIPRSSNPQRIADNSRIFDFTLGRRRDAAHRRAEASERPHRQSGRAGVRRLGLRRSDGQATDWQPWSCILRARCRVRFVHAYPGSGSSPHDVIGMGVAFCAAGIYFMLGAAGYLPMPETNSPSFIIACAGAAFLFAGLTCMVRARAGMTAEQADMPDSAPRTLQLSYRMLAIGVAGALATIGTWIAIGSGPRAFGLSVPFADMHTAGETIGRTCSRLAP